MRRSGVDGGSDQLCRRAAGGVTSSAATQASNQDIGDYRPDQDNFSIPHRAALQGRSMVKGSDVRVSATTIGVIVSTAQAGRDLIVQFNASAPALSETVLGVWPTTNSVHRSGGRAAGPITLSDGDGGAITPTVVTINVTGEADALPLASVDPVNTTPSASSWRPPNFLAATATSSSGTPTARTAGITASRPALRRRRHAGGQRVPGPLPPTRRTARQATRWRPFRRRMGGRLRRPDATAAAIPWLAWRCKRQHGEQRVPGGFEHPAASSSRRSVPRAPASSLPGIPMASATANYYDIFLQRYDASGTPVGTEPGHARSPATWSLAQANHHGARPAAISWSPGVARPGRQQLRRLCPAFRRGDGQPVTGSASTNTTDYQYLPRYRGGGHRFRRRLECPRSRTVATTASTPSLRR